MRLFAALRTLVAFVFRRSHVEGELEEELRSHLQSRADDLECQGLSREEAERQARIEFGGYQRYKEECREAVGTRVFVEFGADLRYGLRQLRRNPGFAAVAILTLALGIGTNTTIFTFVSALLLKTPPAIAEPSRLFAIWNRLPRGEPSYVQQSYPDYVYYRAHSRAFAGLLAFSSDPQEVSWSTSGQSRLIEGQLVSGNFFAMLGVRPLLGRWFSPEEDQTPGRDPIVVLSHSFWQQRLGADPAVVGKVLTLNGHEFTWCGTK
jgi:hypothetical protein